MKSQDLEPRPPEGHEDWTFREIPWVTLEMFHKLIETVGNDNILVISGSHVTETKNNEILKMCRASVFISPEGMENLKNASS